jgi:hypothetical protein
MPKTCNFDGCKYNQFGGGFCANHQYKRTDKKRKVIPKTSKKGRKKLTVKKDLTERDHRFFEEIWEESPHIDFETDIPILGEALTLYFHHVLEKHLYPKFRYKKWNIVLVSWETHSKCHNNMDFVPKIKAYQDYLIKKYLK